MILKLVISQVFYVHRSFLYFRLYRMFVPVDCIRSKRRHQQSCLLKRFHNECFANAIFLKMCISEVL